MGLSNNIIAVLTFIALLCSIPIIASGIWLASKPDSECVRLIRWPVIILGVLILLVSLAGFVGAYWNHQFLLAAFLFLMAALIVLLLALLVFAFVISHKDGAYAVPGRGYKEYRLGGFSDWFQHYIADDDHWVRIRACLSQSDVCGKLARREAYFTADQYFQSDLSPIQAGKIIPEKQRRKTVTAFLKHHCAGRHFTSTLELFTLFDACGSLDRLKLAPFILSSCTHRASALLSPLSTARAA